MKKMWETHGPQETFEIGKQLGLEAKPGEVYCLDGDLGVGKTVFTQGFASGLEEGRLPLYHFDVYRIGDVEEMDEIGYEDCFYGEGVCLIEWSTLIQEILPEDAIHITIEKDLEKGFDYRRIQMEREKV